MLTEVQDLRLATFGFMRVCDSVYISYCDFEEGIKKDYILTKLIHASDYF